MEFATQSFENWQRALGAAARVQEKVDELIKEMRIASHRGVVLDVSIQDRNGRTQEISDIANMEITTLILHRATSLRVAS